jgi:hypothetical protein
MGLVYAHVNNIFIRKYAIVIRLYWMIIFKVKENWLLVVKNNVMRNLLALWSMGELFLAQGKNAGPTWHMWYSVTAEHLSIALLRYCPVMKYF